MFPRNSVLLASPFQLLDSFWISSSWYQPGHKGVKKSRVMFSLLYEVVSDPRCIKMGTYTVI